MSSEKLWSCARWPFLAPSIEFFSRLSKNREGVKFRRFPEITLGGWDFRPPRSAPLPQEAIPIPPPPSGQIFADHHLRIALPFCHLTLRARKPVYREKYPDRFRTWGDWIKTRRLDLKLTKAQLSLNLNVSDVTIYLWERNKVRPSLAQIPKIIEFLGQDPFEKKFQNIGDRIREYRRVHGLTQSELAAKLGVDKKTLYYWERGEHQPQKRLLAKIGSDFVF